ncbi:MAG: hypothetical protein V3V20_08175 [Algisphaera sp.]
MADTQHYEGVSITVLQRESVAPQFGYGSFLVSIVNLDNAPHLIVMKTPDHSYGNREDHLRAVTRRFRVEPKASVQSEILYPALPVNGGDVAIQIDGRLQKTPIHLNIATNHTGTGTARVRLSRDLKSSQKGVLESALERHDDGTSGGSYGGYGYSSTRSGLEMSLLVAPPVAEWSHAWLSYTGYARVVVTERDLKTMPAGVSTALRAYVLAGGQLTVVCKSQWPTPQGWPMTDPEAAPAKEPQDDVATQSLGLGAVQWIDRTTLASAEEAWADTWIDHVADSAKSHLSPMSAENANRTFPVIEGQHTPVRGLLGMMVLFALLIGPVNIAVLSYLKKRMWLLWTVPLGSALFSGAVIAYALISEGITPSARTASITLLDQTTREAVTQTLRGYYAPLTPGDGLHFNFDTWVAPQVEVDGSGYGDNGRGRTLDLTHDQHLQQGWLAARVPAHFELRTVESRRERLDFERLDDGSLAVVNGLGVDIESLHVSDHKSHRYEHLALAAGERAVLRTMPEDRGFILSNKNRKVILKQTSNDVFKVNPFGFDIDDIDTQAPMTFVAELSNTPFVQDGLSGIGDHRVDAIVIGRWQEDK